MPGEHLLDVPVQLAGGGPLPDELRLRPLADLAHRKHRDRHRDQRDQRQQRGDQEHHEQHADDGQHRGDHLAERLLQRLGQVVDVVGDPGQDLPAGLRVEVPQRQPGQLGLHVRAHPEHQPLHDRGGDPALEQRGHRRGGVQGQHDDQQTAQCVEVDALPGVQRQRLDQPGLVALAFVLQPGDHLGLGRPGRDLLGNHPAEDQVRGLAQQPRPGHGQRDVDHGQQQRAGGEQPLGRHVPQQPLARPAEVQGLLGAPPAQEGGRAAPYRGPVRPETALGGGPFHRPAAARPVAARPSTGRPSTGRPALAAPSLAAGPGCWLVTPPPARSAGTARSPGRSRRRPSARGGCRWRRPGRCPEPRSGPRAGSWPPAGPR